MKTSDFDYSLPRSYIAQTPVEPRDHSKLMVLPRDNSKIEHRHFFDIVEYLEAGDILVSNESRVIPARLTGHKKQSGGKVEILLLHRLEADLWETLVRPGRRVNIGTIIEITANPDKIITACVIDRKEGGIRTIRFSDENILEGLGEIPLPPYIHTPIKDPERYQTVYARIAGSVAAPTAGLHFTPALIDQIQGKGIDLEFVTLHVGLDSFRPVNVEDPSQHKMHKEYGELTQELAFKLNKAKAEGRRIISVGTTTMRLLETASHQKTDNHTVSAFKGWTDLLILPGHRFHVADALLTNFHLPCSTLLMMVSAFAGKEKILNAYNEAKTNHYRFYSFGDAMLIL